MIWVELEWQTWFAKFKNVGARHWLYKHGPWRSSVKRRYAINYLGITIIGMFVLYVCTSSNQSTIYLFTSGIMHYNCTCLCIVFGSRSTCNALWILMHKECTWSAQMCSAAFEVITGTLTVRVSLRPTWWVCGLLWGWMVILPLLITGPCEQINAMQLPNLKPNPHNQCEHFGLHKRGLNNTIVHKAQVIFSH